MLESRTGRIAGEMSTVKSRKLNPSPDGILADRGFDVPFTLEQVELLCALFADQGRIADAITDIHDQDQAFDLKRGEFYPELLRAVLSLKKCAAAAYGVSPEQVHANYGSNGSIDTTLAAVKVEESRARDVSATASGGVLMTSPTYFRNYNSASAKDLKPTFVPLGTDFSFDADAFTKAMLRARPSIVILVTPNNPTGMAIPDDDLCMVLDNLPDDTWALVDRTLANVRPEIPTAGLLKRYASKNVIILHSCSKYKGMSHLRIGIALYSNTALASKVRPHLPLGIGLEGCLKAIKTIMMEGALRPSGHIISNITETHRILTDFVEAQPDFSFTDFSGNYCLLLLPDGMCSGTVTAALERDGLIVMGGHEFPEPNHGLLRLHTGGPTRYAKQLCRSLLELAVVRSRSESSGGLDV